MTKLHPVAAVIGAVNKLESRVIPLLARPQGGVAASSRKFREATETDAAEVVFLWSINRKTTPASQSADASQHFLVAQPPLAVMQGGDYAA